MFTEVQPLQIAPEFPVIDQITQEITDDLGQVTALQSVTQVISDPEFIALSKDYNALTLRQNIEAGLQNSKLPTDVLNITRVEALKSSADLFAQNYLKAALKSNLIEISENE